MVRDARVHLLRADAAAGVQHGPTHVLLHGLAAGGLFQLDLIGPLSAYGPVLAPDLPGSILGQTDTPRPGAARVEINARFVPALLDAIGLDRVVLHGWSMGASVAMRTAAWFPNRVAAVVLTNPPLPVPLSVSDRVFVELVGRPMVAAVPGLLRVLMRLAGRRLIDTKLAMLGDPTAGSSGGFGVDLDRVPSDSVAVWMEQLAEVRGHPETLAHAVTAFASVMSDILFQQDTARTVIDSIQQPVLVLWGDRDPLLERATLDAVLRRRPDWELHTFTDAGHGAPIERPTDYATTIGTWLDSLSTITSAQP